MKHIDTNQLIAYFLNKLSFDKETEVQEHLRVCPECRKQIDALRTLYKEFDNEKEEERIPVFKKILHSGWTKAAASVIVILGAGLLIYYSRLSGKHSLQQNFINDERQFNQIFATDTFDKEDSLYYMEHYGEDFGK